MTDVSGARGDWWIAWGLVLLLVAVVLSVLLGGFRRSEEGRDVFRADRHPERPRLTSIPTGAGVYINNVFIGYTPHEYERFDPGVLRIRLEYPGLAPVETLLIVQRDQPAPTFPTFVFPVRIHFNSIPAGARPVVDGRLLRTFDALNFTVAATETVAVGFDLEGERLSSVVRITPLTGFVDRVDTLQWHWQGPGVDGPATVTAVFSRPVFVASDPPGAEIYLDSAPTPLGITNRTVLLPYGDHVITLRLFPYDDCLIPVVVSRDAPLRLEAVLARRVWLAAVDADNPFVDLHARVEWVRRGRVQIELPGGRLETPATLELGGGAYLIRLSCHGYADTTVLLPADAGELTIAMRPERRRHAVEPAPPSLPETWVDFVVREGRHPVEGAIVIGIEKTSGLVVRYGPTTATGEVTASVPLGDYEWRAVKEGFSGKTNTERITGRGRIKSVTLKLTRERRR